MVHKKFITVNGKTYGPYYYESYREDGHVKKRYFTQNEITKKNFYSFIPLIITLSILSIVAISLIFFDTTSLKITLTGLTSELSESITEAASIITSPAEDFTPQETTSEEPVSEAASEEPAPVPEEQPQEQTEQQTEEPVTPVEEPEIPTEEPILEEPISEEPVQNETTPEEPAPETNQTIPEEPTPTKPPANETIPENPEINETIPEEPVIPVINQTINETIPLETNQTINETIPLETNQTINETIPEEPAIPVINQTTNITSKLILLQNIPLIRIAKNSSYIIYLKSYFEGAQDYSFSCNINENITAEFKGKSLILTPDTNFHGSKRCIITASSKDDRIQSNEFTILISSGAIKIETTRDKIKAEKPVKWTKSITLEFAENFTIEIPASAENITIKKIKEGDEQFARASFSITGGAIYSFEKGEFFLFRWVKKFFSFLTSITSRAIEEAPEDDKNKTKEIKDEKDKNENKDKDKNKTDKNEENGTIPEEPIPTEPPTNQTIPEEPIPEQPINETIPEEPIINQTTPETNQTIPEEPTPEPIEEPATNQTTNQTTPAETKTIEIAVDDDTTLYIIEYYTPEPQIYEQTNIYSKTVVLSGPDNLNYTDILTFTNISEQIQVGQESKIKIWWRENQTYVPFDAYDLNNNGKLDYIEWLTPHLSNQTFDIIFITKAEHLDENRTFISDIYEQVKSKDNIWSEPIPNTHYVRATFEHPLTNQKDITLHARSTSNKSISVEVYAENGTSKIATIDNIAEENTYKTYLTNLSDNESYSTFDLKIISDNSTNLEIDWIVDPTLSACGTITTTGEYTLTNSVTGTGTCINITISNVTINCNGYTIYYNSAGANGKNGIDVRNAVNITIKNCIIQNLNSSSSYNGAAINFSRVNNSQIINNSITINGTFYTYNLIYLKDTCVNNKIIGNNLTTTNTSSYAYGINLETSLSSHNMSHNNITGNSIILRGSDTYGIYLGSYGMLNNTISSNNITIPSTTTNYGISLYGAGTASIKNTTVLNNNITLRGNSNNGIYLYEATFTNITNNLIDIIGKINDYGIFLNNYAGNTTVWGNNITISSNSSTNPLLTGGIYTTAGASNSRVMRNSITAIGNVAPAITLRTDYNTIWDNNITAIANTSAYGIYISNALNNNISRNNITTTNNSGTNYGIYFAVVSNLNKIIENIITVYGSPSHVLYILNTNNTQFISNTFNSTENSSWLYSFKSISNFTNNTFETQYGSVKFLGIYLVNGSHNITQKNLNISSNRAYLNTTNLSFMNKSAQITLRGLTFTGARPIVAEGDSNTFTTCNPPRCIKNSNTEGVLNFNVTGWTTYSSEDPTESCGTIDTPGAYTMTQSVSSTQTCFNITTSNVTLDCNGHTIEYDSAGSGGTYSIWTNTSAGSSFIPNNITIKNCIIKDVNGAGSNNYAIYLTSAIYSLIQNNTIYTNSTSTGIGIALATIAVTTNYPKNVTVTGNRIYINGSNNYNYGIEFGSGYNNTIYSNNISTYCLSDCYGIKGSGDFAGNNISSNIISTFGVTKTYATANYGIKIASSSGTLGIRNNNIENNIIKTNGTNNSNIGIYLAPRNNNNISRNVIETNGTNSNHGIYITSEGESYGAENTTILSNNITALGAESYGIYFEKANRSIFNLNIMNNTAAWIYSSNSYFNNFANNTFETSSGSIKFTGLIQINGSHNITQKNLNISSNRAYLNTTNLSFMNKSAQIILSGLTFTRVQPVVAEGDSSTFLPCLAPRCVKNSYTGGIVNFNVTGWTTYAMEEMDKTCGVIEEQGVYVLSNNINSTGTCYTITASNVSLDCNGKTIEYNSAGGNSDNGIRAKELRNITIKNCIIKDINAAGTNGYGINFTSVNSSLIFNNTIQTNGTGNNYGIYLFRNSHNNTVSDNHITTRNTSGISNYGIYLLTNISDTLIANNTIATNGTSATTNAHGIYLSGSAGASLRNTIINNNISVAGLDANYGIFLTTAAANNTLAFNRIETAGSSTSGDNYGIYITAAGSENNTISSNTITTINSVGGDNWGIYFLTGVKKTLVFNNTITTGGTLSANHGIYLYGLTTAVSENNITNNNITTNGSGSNIGIYLNNNARNNSISLNTISTRGSASGGNYGIEITVAGSENNTISDNNITTNGTNANYGIYLVSNAHRTTITSNSIITDGTIDNYGIYLSSTIYNTNISNNVISTSGTGNANRGISLSSTINNNSIINNNISTYGAGINNWGIHLTGTTHENKIIGNRVITKGTNNNYGVLLQSTGENNTIANNNITSSGTGDSNYGIYIQGNDFTNISNNAIDTNGTYSNIGIVLDTSAGNNSISFNDILTRGNTSSGVNYGIDIEDSGTQNNTFYKNKITTSAVGADNHGIYIANYAHNNLFDFNNITAANGTTTYAISILTSNNSIFANNVLLNSTGWIETSSAGYQANFTNTSFVNDYGEVVFNSSFNVNGTQDITLQKLNISTNKAYLNTTNLPFMNTSAQITLRGLSFSNPNVEAAEGDSASFAACNSPRCVEQSYSAITGTYIFNVTGWTTYRAREGTILSECGIISVPGIYNLSSSIATTGGCFNITTSNVTLNCMDRTIEFNSAGKDNAFGVSAISQNNITVTNCIIKDINISGQYTSPINFTGINKGQITNNTLYSNGTTDVHGMIVSLNTYNISINNNTLEVISTSGGVSTLIYLVTDVFNVNITNNNFTQNGTNDIRGIYLFSANNTLIYNNIFASRGALSSSSLVTIGLAQTNNITKNNFTIDSTMGSNNAIRAYGNSNNNNFDSNFIIITSKAGTAEGIFLGASGLLSNNFTRNTIIMNGTGGQRIGIKLSADVNSHFFANNTIYLNGTLSEGIAIQATSYNNTFDTNSIQDYYETSTKWISSATSLNNTFKNTTFENANGSIKFTEQITINGTHSINRANLNITYNKAYLNTTNLSFMNTSAQIILRGLTYVEPRIIYAEGDAEPSATCNSPRCARNSYSGGTLNFNVTGWTTYKGAETDIISACSTIATAGEYTFNQSITSATTCLNITASNVLINCNNSVIQYNSGGTDGSNGVAAKNVQNITIKNCVIKDVNAGGAQGHAINFTTVSNSIIQNNTIYTNGTNYNNGIRLTSTIHNNTLTNNTIEIRGSGLENMGIQMYNDINRNNITGNNITTYGTNTNYGIYIITNTNNNLLLNNIIRTNGTTTNNYGISLNSASGNSIASNNITTGGTSSNHGIMLQNSANNNLINNNKINANGSLGTNLGIYLYNSASGNNVTNNNITTGGTSSNYGIQLSTSVSNSIISNNTIRATGSSSSNLGIYLYSTTSGNTVTNNNITTEGTSSNQGMRLESTANNNIINNDRITTNGTADYNYGILLVNTASRNNITNNIITTGGSASTNIGIYLQTVSENNLTENNISTSGTNSNQGIRLELNANNNTINKNIILTSGTSYNNYGFYLVNTALGNNITNNIITTSGSYNNHGAYLYINASNNTFVNNNITVKGTNVWNYGIYIATDSFNNNFTSNNISAAGSEAYAIYLSAANRSIFNLNIMNNTAAWIYSSNSWFNDFTNNTFETANGSIKFTSLIQINGTHNITQQKLNISTNKAYLNTTNLSFMNKSAQITLRNVRDFIDSRPEAAEGDSNTFATCESPRCIEQSYSNYVFIFNVTGWTTYRAGEGQILVINFTNPTPSNKTVTQASSAEINISITNVADLSEVKFTWNNTNYTIYNDSLVLMLNFDNRSSLGENATKVVDISRYSNNATCSGASCPTLNSSGRYGNAYTYDGSANTFSIAHSASLKPSGTITIAAWVKPNTGSLNALREVYRKEDTERHLLSFQATGNCAGGGGSGGCISFGIVTGGSYAELDVNIQAAEWENQWSYLVATYNGSQKQIFKDGRLIGNATATGALGTSGSANAYIGSSSGTSEFFSGTIDELRIWNISFTPSEVYQMYSSNLKKFASDGWELTINQSLPEPYQNSTNTYSGYAKQLYGIENTTETRTLFRRAIYPEIIFVAPTPNNATNTRNTSFIANISITNASDLAEMKFSLNNTNYTIYNDSLVLMMNFENLSSLGENATFVRDLSRYNNNGTCSGATCPTLTSSGRHGKAYSFDGGDYINLSRMDIANAITVSAWVYSNNFNQNGFVVGKNPVNTQWELFFSAATNELIWRGGAVENNVTCSSPLNSQWHHIVGIQTGTMAYLYIDGVQCDSGNLTTIGNGVGNVEIGRYDGGFYFTGTIDEVRIWNRTLTVAEVYEAYASNLVKYDIDKWAFYVNQSYNATNGLTNGNYTYFGAAKDWAGNENRTEPRTISIYNSLPSLTLFSPEMNASYGNTSVWINISSPGANTIWFYNGTSNQTYTTPVSVTYPQGWHTIFVYANDSLNNINSTNATFLVDSIRPAINFTNPTPNNNSMQGGSSIYVNITSNDTNDHYVFTDFDRSNVFWMKMDETNSTTVFDNSTWGNNGTNYGTTQTAAGRFGKGYDFDGDTDYIQIKDHNSLDIQYNLTISAWMKFDTIPTGYASHPINKWISTADANYVLYHFGTTSGSDNVLRWYANAGGTWQSISGSYTISYGQWYHIVLEYSSATGGQLYINNVTQGSRTGSGTLATTTANLSIGESGLTHNGIIDEVLIFNRSLSTQEIASLYNATANKYYNNFTGLSAGVHTITGYAVDRAGNTNKTEQRIFNLDKSPPWINFTNPTPSNSTLTSNASVEINISITNASDLGEMKFNWNNTNYTIYNDSLVLMMNFDNRSVLGENATKAVDLSRYSNNGTGYNGANWTKAGRFDGAYYFDGVNDYINITSIDNSLNLTGSMTIAAWVKPTSLPAYQMIVTKSGGLSTSTQYELRASNANVEFLLSDDAVRTASKSNVFTINQWTFIVGIVNTTSITVYANNIEGNPATLSGTRDTTLENLAIGIRKPSIPQNYFNGSIDEVRIWNRSLSAAEVYESYASNLVKYDIDKWAFYVNQSYNATTKPTSGNYTYFGTATDLYGNTNSTETRTIRFTDASEECGTISNPGVYTLINSVSSVGTCYTITASNVTLNCNGKTIEYNSAGANDTYGITSTNMKNLTIKNCIIKDINASGARGHTIMLTTVNNSLVQNNTLYINGTEYNYGIYLSTNNYNNTIYGNRIYTQGSSYGNYGVYLYSTGSGNNISSNNITTNGTSSNTGIRLNGAMNSSIIANNITTGGSASDNYGMLIQGSSNSNLIYNNKISAGGSTSNNYGVYLITTVSGNNITNNNITTSGTSNNRGIVLQANANNNFVTNNIISTGGSLSTNYGILLFSTVSGNNITGNNISTNGISTNYGIMIQTSANNNLINNNLISTGGSAGSNYGIRLFDASSGNNLTNNNITTNGTSGNYGIRLDTNANNNLVNSNLISTRGSADSNYGILLVTTVSGNNLTNNNITTSGTSLNWGIVFQTNANNNTLVNNRITTNGTSNYNYGILLLNTASGNNITNNVVIAGGSASTNVGIYLQTVSENNLAENNISTSGTSSNYGIKIQLNSHNNTIHKNIILASGTANSNYGLYLTDRVYKNNITNNIVTTSGTSNNSGIFLETNASNNTFVNNNITARGTTNFNHGILITDISDGNNFTNNNISTIGITGYIISIIRSNVTIFESNIFNNTASTASWIYSDNSYQNNFTNNTFETANGSIKFIGLIQISGTHNITRQKLNISTNKAHLNSTNLSFMNVSAVITLRAITLSAPSEIVDLEDDGTYLPCTAPRCKRNYFTANVLSFNVTSWTTYSSEENDTTAPTVTLNYPANDSTFNYRNITFNCSASDTHISNITLRVWNASGVQNFTNTSSSDSIMNTINFTDGAYKWSCSAYDTYSNIAWASNYTFIIDTLNPYINFTNPTPSNNSVNAGSSLYINITSNDTNDHYVFSDFDRSNVLWMRMDDANSTLTGLGTKVYDNSTWGNNGTAINHANQTTAGRFGKGYQFDGVDDYIDAGTNVLSTSNHTVSIWFNTRQLTNGDIISDRSTSSVYSGFVYDIMGNTLRVVYYWAPSNYATITTSFTETNNWHHMIGRLTGNNLSLYLDGTIRDSNTITFEIDNTASTYIGFRKTGGGAYFNGTIDEVLIFNRSLSVQEIASLYNATANKYYNNFTSLSNGAHTVRGFTADRAGNTNSTETRIINIDATAPTVTLNTPFNDSWFNTRIVTFNYTPSGTNLQSCTLYSNFGGSWAANTTNTSITSGVAVVTQLTLNPGSYIWTAKCNNTAGTNGWASANWTVGVDIINPAINFTNPTPNNNSIQGGNSIYINITSNDTNDHYVFTDFDRSLLLWMRMDDVNQTGLNAKVYDNSTWGNNGTAYNNANQTSAGRFGRAYAFDGDSDIINVIDSQSLGGMQEITISAWVYTKTHGDYITVLNKRYSYLYTIDSSGYVKTWTGTGSGWGANVLTSTSTIENNRWYHIVMTSNATGTIAYLNGAQNGTGSTMGTIADNSDPVEIGYRDLEDSQPFIGTIDEVLMFNRSLSSSEIASLYNATANKYYNNFTGLSNGAHTVRGFTADRAGNTNSTEQRTINLDATTPSVVLNAPFNDSWFNTRIVTFNYTPSGTNLQSCTLHSNFGGSWAANTTNTSITSGVAVVTQLTLNPGSYIWNAKCNNTAGTDGWASANWTIGVDIINPAINFTNPTPSNNSVNAGSSLYINITSNDTNDHYVFSDFDRSLLFWMRMDDANSTTVYDNSTYANNGTIFGEANQTTAGRFGKAFQFDGSMDYLKLSSNIYIGNTNWTASAWIKTSSSGHQSVISNNASGPVYNLLGVNTGKIEYYHYNNSWQAEYGTSIISDNKWYFLTWLNHDNRTIDLYVNGVAETVGASSALSGTSIGPVDVIGKGWSSGYSFNGAIDEIIIINRSLSTQEISALYNATANKYYNNFTNLAAGAHTVRGFTADRAGNTNSTEQRIIRTSNLPIITQVTLNSTNVTRNDTNQNLTATIVSASDADNDPIQNITDWKIWNNSMMRSIAVLNMPFETNTSDSTATGIIRDYSISGNNGTASSGTIWNVSGKAGSAYSYDDGGENEYIEILSSPSLTVDYEGALSMWVYPINSPSDNLYHRMTRVYWSDSTGWLFSKGYSDGTAPNTLYWYELGTDNNIQTSSADLTANNWHHIAYTWKVGEKVKVYVNGAYKAQSGANLADRSRTMSYVRIGQRWNGSIDELMIFNRSLSAGQIYQMYLDGSAGRHMMTIHSGETNVNDTWQVCATPNDRNLDGATVCSNNLTILDINPTVTLDKPNDNYFNDTARFVNITFNASVSDDASLVNCSLWHNSTGTWHRNQSETRTGTTNFTNFTVYALSNRTFIWNIECRDSLNQAGWGAANRTVILNWTEEYGWLNVTLISPIGTNSQPQNSTFILRANVTCLGTSFATCGAVNGTLRYNATISMPNTTVQGNNVYAAPFYTIGLNPFNCSTLNTGNTCNLTLTVNTTGVIGTNWKLDVNFTSNKAGVISNTTNYTVIRIISPTLSITLSDALFNISFGPWLNPGVNDYNATNNSNSGYYVTCQYEPGSCNVSIRGNRNFTSGINMLGLGNSSWNTVNQTATQKAFTSAFNAINETLSNLASQLIYFWLDVPSSQVAGTYTSNFTIQGEPN